ncbi:MAG: hypothetical protein IPL84_00715 [Chitinophagaceae bacterium]|nr:hypothetical protein [Chitinophagaceae bacterium]
MCIFNNHKIRKVSRHIFYLLSCLLTFMLAGAQSPTSYSIHFTDTLPAVQSFLLYNNIVFKNLTADSMQLKVKFRSAEGWHLLSPEEAVIDFLPGEKISLPVTLKQRTAVSSIWQQITFIVESVTSKIKDTFSFSIYSEPLSKFSVTNIVNGLSSSNSKDIQIQFVIKNTGNVDGMYHCRFQNENLDLDHNRIFALKPGKDTVIYYTHHIPKKNWKQFTNETIRLIIADSLFKKASPKEKPRFIRSSSGNAGSHVYYHYFDVYKTDSVFSMHKSDYPNINLGLETGFIGSSRQVSYYVAFRAMYDISRYSKFTFNYRSHQFGLYNTIDKDVFTIGLKTRHWEFKAGKISNSKYFITYGNGIEVSYSPGKNSMLTFFAVKHTPGFHTTNDNAGLLVKYRIKNAVINHDILYNTDSFSRIRSGIFNTDINWRTKNLDLNINGGLGTGNKNSQNKGEAPGAGVFWGYRIVYKMKSWTLNSQYKTYGRDFPGLYAGSKVQNHGLIYRAKKFSAELYYQVNITNNNFFIDTLYNRDFLTFNTTKYGTKMSISAKRTSITVGYGRIVQTGQQAYTFTPRYQFVEMQLNLRDKKYFSLNFSTSNGYAAQSENTSGPVYFTINSLNVSYKNIGINGGYTSIPVVDKLQKPIYNSTVYGGPYISAQLGKYFSLGLQYNLSKTLFDNGVNSFAGINFAYNNEKARTNIQVNVSSPLKKANEQSVDPFKYGYVNISLIKTFDIPFVFKKKYYKLETIFVEDMNLNGKADSNENRLANVKFSIDDLHFISSQLGVASYRHIDKGEYTINLSGSSLRGLVPNEGSVHTIKVERDNETIILFSKSCVLSGHIEILQDSAADELFLVNNIKITAIDGSGKKYATITDTAGNYYFNLPAGMYSVMLNQEAFNQNYRPDKVNAEANLVKNAAATVNFVIKQKRRLVRMLDPVPGTVIDLKQPEKLSTDDKKPKPAKPKH